VQALTAYPPVTGRRPVRRHLVVKGPDELPALLAAVLAEFGGPRQRRRGIIDAEVDPIEWPS
jgi:hypothetical protein